MTERRNVVVFDSKGTPAGEPTLPNGDADPDYYYADGAGEHDGAGEQLPDYEPAHAKTMAALPAASGDLCDASLLLYLAPDSNCNVAYVLELFAPQVSSLRLIPLAPALVRPLWRCR